MKGSRSLLLSCLLALVLVQSGAAAYEGKVIARINDPLTDITGGSDTSTTSNTQQTSATSDSTSATSAHTSASASQTSNTSATQTSASSTNTATSNTASATSPTQTGATNTTPTHAQTSDNNAQTSVIVSTGPTGTVTITQTSSGTSSATSSSSSSSSTSGADTSNSDSDSGVSTGTIIGLSVAGGLAALGIIAFFVWKFTRKRFSDFDDNEAIKWPELNTHAGDGGDSHPLPVHNTGRAGFDTGSEVSLSRAPSTSNHTNYSTPDFGNDPYAVPPLPHLNPNQPYRDDPNATGAYYDPYRGPVPGTFSEPGTATEWGPQAGRPGEAYPMTQMGGVGSTGRASPGPTVMGRASPAPGQAYDMRAVSPQPPLPGGAGAYPSYGGAR